MRRVWQGQSRWIDLLTSVADPEALLAAVAEHRPDAVLTDIRKVPTAR